jgi:hypothetical protein
LVTAAITETFGGGASCAKAIGTTLNDTTVLNTKILSTNLLFEKSELTNVCISAPLIWYPTGSSPIIQIKLFGYTESISTYDYLAGR